jgi:hypothetical protein
MVSMPEEPDDPKETGDDDEAFKTLRGPLTGNDPEEPSYFAYRATLRVFGSIQNLDEITRTLGLVPTHVHHRGELRHPSAKAYDRDMWLYEAPVRSLNRFTFTSMRYGRRSVTRRDISWI